MWEHDRVIEIRGCHALSPTRMQSRACTHHAPSPTRMQSRACTHHALSNTHAITCMHAPCPLSNTHAITCMHAPCPLQHACNHVHARTMPSLQHACNHVHARTMPSPTRGSPSPSVHTPASISIAIYILDTLLHRSSSHSCEAKLCGAVSPTGPCSNISNLADTPFLTRASPPRASRVFSFHPTQQPLYIMTRGNHLCSTRGVADGFRCNTVCVCMCVCCPDFDLKERNTCQTVISNCQSYMCMQPSSTMARQGDRRKIAPQMFHTHYTHVPDPRQIQQTMMDHPHTRSIPEPHSTIYTVLLHSVACALIAHTCGSWGRI